MNSQIIIIARVNSHGMFNHGFGLLSQAQGTVIYPVNLETLFPKDPPEHARFRMLSLQEGSLRKGPLAANATMDQDMINAAINDLGLQLSGSTMPLKKKAMATVFEGLQMKCGQPTLVGCLFFETNRDGDDLDPVAYHGAGLNGRKGLVTFGLQAVVGWQLVAIWLEGTRGYAAPIYELDLLRPIIDDLEEQLEIVKATNATATGTLKERLGSTPMV